MFRMNFTGNDTDKQVTRAKQSFYYQIDREILLGRSNSLVWNLGLFI